MLKKYFKEKKFSAIGIYFSINLIMLTINSKRKRSKAVVQVLHGVSFRLLDSVPDQTVENALWSKIFVIETLLLQ